MKKKIIDHNKLLVNYLNYLKRKDLSLNTVRNYHYVVKKYLKIIKDFTTANLKTYIKKSLNSLSPTTCQENLNILLLYTKYCQIKKIKKEEITRIIPKSQSRFFPTITFFELQQLKKARFEKQEIIWQRNNFILETLFYTGVRVSELVNLRHSDYDYNSKMLKIFGKGNKYRWVFIVPWLQEKFNPQSKDYVFKNQLKTKIWRHYITGVIHQRTILAGIKKNLTAHSFRRSFATVLNNNGAKLTSIQKFLGHARLETTANYIHNDYETLYQDYSKIFPNNEQITPIN